MTGVRVVVGAGVGAAGVAGVPAAARGRGRFDRAWAAIGAEAGAAGRFGRKLDGRSHGG